MGTPPISGPGSQYSLAPAVNKYSSNNVMLGTSHNLSVVSAPAPVVHRQDLGHALGPPLGVGHSLGPSQTLGPLSQLPSQPLIDSLNPGLQPSKSQRTRPALNVRHTAVLS